MGNDKLSAAILRAVATTALATVADSSCYVATMPQGTPLTAEHMAVLADPDAGLTSVPLLRAAVELSQLVDLVQDGSPVFAFQRIGQPYLSDLARQLPGQVSFARPAMSAQQQNAFQQAQALLYSDPPVRTPEFDAYEVLKADVAVAVIDLQLREREAAQAPEADRPGLQADLADRRARLALQQAQLVAADARHHFEDAKAVLASYPRGDFPAAVKDALGALDSNLLSIDSGEQTHVRAMFRPDALREGAWVRIRLTRADLNAAPADDPLVPPLPAGAATLDPSAVDAVELEVQVLTLERPWFWDALFGNHYWRPVVSGQVFSDGASPAHGDLPAYPVAVVVARNLTVLGQVPQAGPAPVRLGNLVLSRAIAEAGVVAMTSQAHRLGELTSLPTSVSRRQLSAAPAGLSSRVTARRAQIRVRAVLQLRDSEGAAIAGATVRVLPDGTPPEQAHVLASADDGNCEVLLSSPGTAQIFVSRAGFEDLTQQVHLDARTPTTITVVRSGTAMIAIRSSVSALSPMLAARARIAAQPTALVAAPAIRGLTVATGALRARIDLDDLPDKVVRGPIVQSPPIIIRPPAAKTATLTIRTELQGEHPGPTGVPVQVNLTGPGDIRAAGTVGSDGVLSLVLPLGSWRVEASCGVYDPEQPATTVQLSADASLTLAFRSRTVLTAPEAFLMALVCRATPRAPDPAADAVW